MTKSLPSGLKTAARTGAECARKTGDLGRPFCSQSRTVVSSDVVATTRPSGEKKTLTGPRWWVTNANDGRRRREIHEMHRPVRSLYGNSSPVLAEPGNNFTLRRAHQSLHPRGALQDRQQAAAALDRIVGAIPLEREEQRQVGLRFRTSDAWPASPRARATNASRSARLALRSARPALLTARPPAMNATTSRTASTATPPRARRRARRCWRMSSPSSSSFAIPCIGAARSATADRNPLLRRSRSVSSRAQRKSRCRGSSVIARRKALRDRITGETTRSRSPSPTRRRSATGRIRSDRLRLQPVRRSPCRPTATRPPPATPAARTTRDSSSAAIDRAPQVRVRRQARLVTEHAQRPHAGTTASPTAAAPTATPAPTGRPQRGYRR